MTAPALLVGGGGGLGRELLRAAPSEVVALPRDAADVTWPAAELRRVLAAHRDVHGARCVVNLAARTSLPAVERREVPDAEAVMADGPGRLADACAALGLYLLHVSTDYVFGEGRAPYAPWDDHCPGTRYGELKARGEDAALEGGASVARVCFVRSVFSGGSAFSGPLANREHADQAAARLLRILRWLPARGWPPSLVLHAVPAQARDLAAVLLERYPLPVEPVGVAEARLRLPYRYPRDTRLSHAWEET